MKLPRSLLLVIGLVTVLASCAKKQDQRPESKIEQNGKQAIYQDAHYPITIDHDRDPSKIRIANGFTEYGYRIDVEVDFREVVPDLEVLSGAYEIITYDHERDFRKHHKLREPITRETELNGTPAIFIRNPANNYEEYCLLIPGVYNRVTLDGIDMSEKLTREALKHFHWTEPIDTNSKEFKTWKAHIWEILNSSKEKNRNEK